MISFFSYENLTICNIKNGFLVIHKQSARSDLPPELHEQFVFRNVEELCEWIKEFYQKKPI